MGEGQPLDRNRQAWRAAALRGSQGLDPSQQDRPQGCVDITMPAPAAAVGVALLAAVDRGSSNRSIIGASIYRSIYLARARYDAWIIIMCIGPLTTPIGKGHVSLNLTLRKVAIHHQPSSTLMNLPARSTAPRHTDLCVSRSIATARLLHDTVGV